jgi:hypothetical protein
MSAQSLTLSNKLLTNGRHFSRGYPASDLRRPKLKAQRKVVREKSVQLSEAEASSIVEAGGGKFVGFFEGIPERMESIVLFISPQTRTTLGIPISRLTAAAVFERLAESNAAFSETGSK